MKLFWQTAFILAALGLLIGAWLVPAHLRAIDAQLLDSKNLKTPGLVSEGLDLINHEKLSPAQMFLEAAQREHLPGSSRLQYAVTNLAAEHSELALWGGLDDYLDHLFSKELTTQPLKRSPIIEFLLPEERRATLLLALSNSRKVRQILATGDFASTSTSKQPREMAVLITGLLVQEGHLSESLQNTINALATKANHGIDRSDLETVYGDILTLGMRLDWTQLSVLMPSIKSVRSLHDLTWLIRTSEDHLPTLYAAVLISGSPEKVTAYLARYGEAGWADLGFSLRGGSDGLSELLKRQQRVYYSTYQAHLAARPPFDSIYQFLLGVCKESNTVGLMIKYLLMVFAGGYLAMALRFLLRQPQASEKTSRMMDVHPALPNVRPYSPLRPSSSL